jgi:uncharacterized protein YjbI with pentapeptide repeats
LSEARFSESVDFRETRFASESIFRQTRFLGDANFSSAHFLGNVNFAGADFAGMARFDAAKFQGRADFNSAKFRLSASFDEAEFCGHTNFAGATFHGFVVPLAGRLNTVAAATFKKARFQEWAAFTGTSFDSAADFGNASFDKPLSFLSSHFSKGAHFREAEFKGNIWLTKAEVLGDLDFRDAVFRSRVMIGPLAGSGALYVDGAKFLSDARIDASFPRMSCSKTYFGGMTELNLRWAEVALNDTSFVKPSRVAAADKFSAGSPPEDIEDCLDKQCPVDRAIDAQAQPRLMTLRQANVEDLALNGIDLRPCHFFRAHGLEQLRVEADCTFARPPQGRFYARRESSPRRRSGATAAKSPIAAGGN